MSVCAFVYVCVSPKCHSATHAQIERSAKNKGNNLKYISALYQASQHYNDDLVAKKFEEISLLPEADGRNERTLM